MGSFMPYGIPCIPDTGYFWNQFPGGSQQQYLGSASLWIGALIVEHGYEIKRVSIAEDGWLNPPIQEFWPGAAEGITERSRLDTSGCWSARIYNDQALADHEVIATFEDTLRDSPYVMPDPVDGPHRPLGIKVTRTTYSTISSPCNDILGIQFHIENIGSNFLKEIYVGFLIQSEVRRIDPYAWDQGDDLVGFYGPDSIAYCCDNDGRDAFDSTGNDFTVPHVTGFCYMGTSAYGIPQPQPRRVSYNWWIPNMDPQWDYGPAWEDYSERDSMRMGWTNTYGSPMGDEHKYQLMSNGEIDFDQVQLNDIDWIASHPQNGKTWSIGNRPSNTADIANGYYVSQLYSVGPIGIPDYQDASGRWIFRLNPGESCDVWFAYIGGRNLHDPANPQPTNRVINPDLYNFSDLHEKALMLVDGTCANWMQLATERPAITLQPSNFAVEPLYPNPFNASVRIAFTLNRTSLVDVRVFDVLGREVAQLASNRYESGRHEIYWDASRFGSGIYFIESRARGSASFVQKAVLLK
jgi:hypothetical protein